MMENEKNNLLNRLEAFINQPEAVRKNEDLEKLIKTVEQLCELKPNIILTYNGNRNCFICDSFLKEDCRNTVTLTRCKHSFHKNCINKDLMKFCDKQPYEDKCQLYECPYKNCKQLVNLTDVANKIFTRREWDEIQTELAKKISLDLDQQDRKIIEERTQKKEFGCPICLENKLVRLDCITLDCDHQVCRNCLQEHLKAILNSGKVSEEDRICPYDKCKLPIAISIIQDNFNKEEMSKFLNLTIIQIKSQSDNEKFVRCPNAGCDYIFLYTIGRDPPFPECHHCKKKFCVRGCEDIHEGVTCENYQTWRKENGMADERFEAFVKDNLLRGCPSCGAICQKNGGCNFIVCRCKVEFCYVCGARAVKSHVCPNGHPVWS